MLPGGMSFIFGASQRQFIARPESAKDAIVYKWPEDNIRAKSQLTVEPDERAVFVKQGQVAGIVDPGRHTLDGADIPFIGSLIDAATGGRFLLSELYFILTREVPELLFGASLDTVTDPTSKLLARLAVHGDYALRVTDGVALVTNLVGTEHVADAKITDWVRDQIAKVMKGNIIAHITREGWPIFGISAYTAQMEQEALAQVQAQLAPYGLTVTRFGNFNVVVDPDDLARIEAFVTRTQAIAQQAGGSITKLAAADALEGFGEGAAKGNAEGMGNLIVGAGLGNAMQSVFAAGAGAPSAAPAAPAEPSGVQVRCPKCGTLNAESDAFCSHCGASLQAAPSRCPHCGQTVPAGAEFCPHCGQSLQAA